MRKCAIAAVIVGAGLTCALVFPRDARAQQQAQPAPAYPQPAPAYPQPAPAYAQPAPAYAQPAPAYAQPAPAYAQPAPASPYASPAYPPADPPRRWLPPSSVRLDVWNLVLQGRLALEFETAPLDWLSIEMVPVFVLGAQPVGNRLSFERDEQIYQGSAGVGPLAGASVGVGFWLDGEALRGTVVRAGMTFYGYEYEAKTTDGKDRLDRVVDNQRRVTLMLGDNRRWGHFTLSTGFGLEYELKDDRRCFADGANEATSSGCKVDELQLATSQPSAGGVTRENVHGFLHPLYFAVRLSLGVVF